MTKSAIERVADFLLEFLPEIMPSNLAKGVAKGTVAVVKEQLKTLAKQPRIQRELMEAARNAESCFLKVAAEELGNDQLVQAVTSFPLWNEDLFQQTLRQLPEHWNEKYLESDLQFLVTKGREGKFTDEEFRQAVAIYLDCLRDQLLKVEEYGDLIDRLATKRIDQRTSRMEKQNTQILEGVGQLPERVVKRLKEDSVAAQSVVSALFTIRPPVSDFTGREEELEELRDSFSRGVLITGLSGGGGVGKTELARRLALELEQDFPDARLEIDLLGTLETPLGSDEVMRRLLEPFFPAQKLPDGLAQLSGLYQQTFANHKALLLLDNAADASQVRLLIPPPPSAALVTSRQHFSLSEFGLDKPFRLDVLPSGEARDLLRKAAPELAHASGEKLDELAQMCGRLPLALRVAAALLNDREDWTLATLLKRLAEERTRLKRLKREKDLDVEATLNLSYALLDDTLKKHFRKLGVFPAPFWDTSAAAIWGLEDSEEVNDVLGALLNRSLLTLSPSPFKRASDDSPLFLYALHDLTRLHALDRLSEQGEYKPTMMTHAGHYLELADHADSLYIEGGDSVIVGLNLFRVVWPHLLIAWERLSSGQKNTKKDANQVELRWLSDLPSRCVYVLDLHLPPRQKTL